MLSPPLSVGQPSNSNALSGPKRVNTLPAAHSNATPNGNGHEAPVVEDESIDVETSETENVEPTTAPAGPRTPRQTKVPIAISIDTETGMSVGSFVAQYKLNSPMRSISRSPGGSRHIGRSSR
jgi:hypothetical protein